MHAHKHTRVHLHTSAAPDLSGPAKPIEGLWRFICHSNVFLGKMPAQGEPRYSGRDTVVFSVSDKSCVSVSLSYSTSLRACVVCVCGGGAISQIYGNWNGRIFWGKCSQFDSAAKKVTLFNLHSMAYEVRQGNTWKQTILSRPHRLHHLPTA